MARVKLTDISTDVSSDSGAVLWSFVKGEALEFPIILDFLGSGNAVGAYTFEAVVVEAANIADQVDKPISVEPGGENTVLNVRSPILQGTWNPATGYFFENVVFYAANSKYYRLKSGANYISSMTPDTDPAWEETTLNRVYVQFPSTLASEWSQQPTISTNTYGFFELRVTEPSNPIFVRTWKPVRGMVEILFSPTDVV